MLPDGSALAAVVADPAGSDPVADTVAGESAELLVRALTRLSPRQRRFVGAQWGLGGDPPASGVELARELGLSPRRTQTIGRDALYRLREALEPVGARA